jgi:hypothetical protein
MSEPRSAVAETYDALLDLASTPELGAFAYVLVKRSYHIEGDRCREVEPEPLSLDLRPEETEPRLQAGSDFWPVKRATDVVVQGAAWAPPGRKVRQTEVSVQVGEAVKRVAVFGRREVGWDLEDRPWIGEPDYFDHVPLTWDNAYGGLDWRVRPRDADGPWIMELLKSDHPGMYPRNPFGKGYLVVPGEVPEMLMPQLEDPDDLLTGERLVLGNPRRWYEQPWPCCTDWVHPISFPRCVLFAPGVDAWFPGPDDEGMPEVRKGLLMPGYRALMEERGIEGGPHPDFYQEGAAGLVMAGLRGDEPVVLRGLHPEREEIFFRLPGAPQLSITLEGDVLTVEPRLHHVVIRPGEERLTTVWAGSRPLTRMFTPGLHRQIPLEAAVDGEPVVYQTPPTIKDQIAAGKAAAEAKGKTDVEKADQPT